ncbi:L7Ae/L30e/S12e/Gadd45 family ribosomal protein [Clostridium merdae]|uniref:L7Ae/L30e/S12e/Gadd45 family ribosomal protein n=1 Tax=Clostridium merdae TaxID=1958780 RepID=UPI000A2682DF|nr:ribosomal L7Ae/L30e/S12e/Gadd45 family protein [Clostridium merdae]
MTNRVLSLLGIARRAGRLSLGHDAVDEALKKREAKLIVLAQDVSARTATHAQKAAQQAEVPCLILADGMDEIGMAIGKKIGVIAVNDQGFAKRLTELANEAADKREG